MPKSDFPPRSEPDTPRRFTSCIPVKSAPIMETIMDFFGWSTRSQITPEVLDICICLYEPTITTPHHSAGNKHWHWAMVLRQKGTKLNGATQGNWIIHLTDSKSSSSTGEITRSKDWQPYNVKEGANLQGPIAAVKIGEVTDVTNFMLDVAFQTALPSAAAMKDQQPCKLWVLKVIAKLLASQWGNYSLCDEVSDGNWKALEKKLLAMGVACRELDIKSGFLFDYNNGLTLPYWNYGSG